jgi:DNA polymerase-1
MSLKPATPEAFDLLLQGSLAMAEIERAGIRIDIAYLDRAIAATEKEISVLQKTLRASEEFKLWSREFGERMTLGSNWQLARVVFDLMGEKRNPLLVARGREKDTAPSNDVKAFEHLNIPFVSDWFKLKRLDKALGTYLMGMRREVVGEYLHPFFHLHTAESYRGSSDRINFQNFPVRNKGISKIVRSAVIPREGNVLLEADYGQQEVRVAACYTKDPKLISYIVGGGDMHKDFCMELYMLTEEELGDTDIKGPAKDSRYCAKNMFTFPQFYGSVYAQCAPNLWDAIKRMSLTRSDGLSLYDHLKGKGITKLGACDYEQEPRKGTFELQVQKVERRMWQEVFTVYDRWKKDWWNTYLRQGGVNTLTGFRMEGVFRRNQVLCDPIQGSAFHCLLWSAIPIQKEIKRRGMKALMICQIHDSMLFDCPKKEIEDLTEIIREYAVRQVSRHWKWICVPLAVDFESSETNWFSKSKLQLS